MPESVESSRLPLNRVELSNGLTVGVRQATGWDCALLGMIPIELLDHALARRKKKDPDEPPDFPADEDDPTAEKIDRRADFTRFAAAQIVAVEWDGAWRPARFVHYPADEEEYPLDDLADEDLVAVRDAALGFDWTELSGVVEHWTARLVAAACERIGMSPHDFLNRPPVETAVDLALILGARDGG